VAHRCEQLARLAQRLLGTRLAEGDQAAAATKQSFGAFGHEAELLPAFGRLGIQSGGVAMLSGGFGEDRSSCAEGVLVQREERFDTVHEPLREGDIARGDGRADHLCEPPGVVTRGAGVWHLLQFGEQLGGHRTAASVIVV